VKKLDRLGWTVGTRFRAYGLSIGLRADDAGLLERMKERLPYGSQPAASRYVDRIYYAKAAGTKGSVVRRFNLLYTGANRIARADDTDEFLDAFETDARRYVAEHARTRLFVHAGVVAWRGRAIVIPGRSFSGKTTLVSALLRAGAVYYSDEYAVFDDKGRVHPFLKPLSVREEGSHRGSPHPVESFGARRGSGPLPLGCVVATEYREGARWRPKPLSPGKGALALFAHAVAARREPERVLRALTKATAGATILSGVRGEAEAAAAEILSRLSRAEAPASDAQATSGSV